jgi:ribosome biogenesis GTP-binding protein YsxC/EngB
MGVGRVWTMPCCVLLTAALRAPRAVALSGLFAGHAHPALLARARALASTARARARVTAAAPTAADRQGEGEGGPARGAVPFPATLTSVSIFCADCVHAKAPRKLFRSYAAALEPEAAADDAPNAAAPLARAQLAAETLLPATLAAVIAALVKAERADLAAEVHAAYDRAATAARAGAVGGAAAPDAADETWCDVSGRLLRACCRAGNVTAAEAVWASISRVRAAAAAEPAADGARAAERSQRLDALAASTLPSLVCAHLREGGVGPALALVNALPPAGPACADRSYAEMLRWFGKANSFAGILGTLRAMAAARATAGAESLDQLASAAVKQTAFVTGAVSLATLPQSGEPELAFIGRSNVGKSSLVNMALGRKALAYASNTPGKTQQFNFFAVNREAPAGHARFLLADLPGVGFAKVPAAVRATWSGLLREYFENRRTLRLLCHLVDGNVGPKAADLELMALIASCAASGGFTGRYAVILTKIDRPIARAALRSANDAGASAAGPSVEDFVVPERVAREVRLALAGAGLPADTPVLATSAKSKLGRADFWRLVGGVLEREGGAH